MDLKLSEKYLDELIDYIGRSLVGKVMKRYELISDKETLKNMIKETIYEEMRHLRDLIYAANIGLEVTQFKFKSQISKEGEK